MAVQKSRKSHAAKGKRRSHHALENRLALSIDPTTGTTHRRHHLSTDGYYKGRQVIIVNEAPEEE